ncbi:MAG: hypothetical protein ACPG4T_11955 [Nannocystaceae bacterium]
MPKSRNSPEDLTEALSAPLGDLIAAVGRGVAEAQRAMDASTIASIRELDQVKGDIGSVMRSIGYRPNWYQIPKVEADLTVSLTIGGEAKGGRLQLYAAPTDASYTNKYAFDLQAVSKLKFSVVAVPPTPEQAGLRVVPRLAKTPTVDAYVTQLERLQIPYVFDGHDDPPADATIQRVEPRPGTLLRADQALTIHVLPPEQTEGEQG